MKMLTTSKLVILMNRFYELVSSVTLNYKGKKGVNLAVIVDSTADSTVIVFGAPFPSENDIFQSIDAALDIRQGLVELNKRNDELGLPPFSVSFGVSTGQAICSVAGPTQLKKYSVIGGI